MSDNNYEEFTCKKHGLDYRIFCDECNDCYFRMRDKVEGMMFNNWIHSKENKEKKEGDNNGRQ